ncbi:DUF4192 domain-containing protein [Nonomuraea sp. NPDC050328]|uniref:DUF4192 domain-containing protein n=1 Tax=Nonomuraea sp. NPDC050328 TaxID=3364361 RepID=UPI0037BC9980
MTAEPSPTPSLILTNPTDLLAAVPYLFGFHPAKSLVALGISGTELRIAARWDLPLPPHALDPLIPATDREALTHLLAVGYGPGPLVTPAIDTLRTLSTQTGLPVAEALRVEDGRYWSYLCDLTTCCPPDGSPYDPKAAQVAAEATVQGLVAHPDRATLQRTLAPYDGPLRLAMRTATTDAATTLTTRITAGAPASTPPTDPPNSPSTKPKPASPPTTQAAAPAPAPGTELEVTDAFAATYVAEALSRIRKAMASATTGPRLTDHEAAQLGFDLAIIRVRDEAWTAMDVQAHLPLWRDLTRRLEPRFVPPAASLLAMAAWRSGDCVLASLAVERALTINPYYSMAGLIRHALVHMMSPSALRDRMPTPADLDRSMGPPNRLWMTPMLALLTSEDATS